MRGRPRTPVTLTVPVLRRKWVRFAWMGPLPVLDDAAMRALDAWWDGAALTGAIFLHPATEELVETVRPKRCGVPELVANVALRSRGALLLAGMELLDDPRVLTDLDLLTDDPRLVALSPLRA